MQPSIKPHDIHPSVDNLNLERIKWKILNDDSMNRIEDITPEIVDLSEREYRRFLTLRLENPGVRFSPTELMDLFWHAHILDTVSYVDDCNSLFGEYLHHVPNFGPHQKPGVSFDGDAWKVMCKLYNQRFGSEPVSNFNTGGNCNVDGCHTACGNVHCSDY